MDHADNWKQKKPQPFEDKAEVIAGGGEDGVDGVGFGPCEIVAVHAMAVLEVADDGFDSEAASDLCLDRERHAARLA